MRTRFKICCMSSESELRAAVEAGADALGFVSHIPGGAGIISDELSRRLVPLVRSGWMSVPAFGARAGSIL